MISSQRTATIAILCTFKRAIQQVRHLERGKKCTKKATKNDIERRARSQKGNVPHKDSSMYFFSVTQSFRLGFWWGFDNITVSKKKRAHQRKSLPVYEITISYLHKSIIIPVLCQCVLFVQICVFKNSIVSKDVIF